MSFKHISYLGLWQSLFRLSKTIWTSGSRRDVVKDLSRALAALVFSGVEPFKQFCSKALWGTFM